MRTLLIAAICFSFPASSIAQADVTRRLREQSEERGRQMEEERRQQRERMQRMEEDQRRAEEEHQRRVDDARRDAFEREQRARNDRDDYEREQARRRANSDALDDVLDEMVERNTIRRVVPVPRYIPPPRPAPVIRPAPRVPSVSPIQPIQPARSSPPAPRNESDAAVPNPAALRDFVTKAEAEVKALISSLTTSQKARPLTPIEINQLKATIVDIDEIVDVLTGKTPVGDEAEMEVAKSLTGLVRYRPAVARILETEKARAAAK